MTPEEISLVQWSIFIVSIGATVSISVAKYFKYKEAQAKENSLGAAKVAEFLEVQRKQDVIIKEMKAAYDRVEKELVEIGKDYKEMVQTLVRFVDKGK